MTLVIPNSSSIATRRCCANISTTIWNIGTKFGTDLDELLTFNLVPPSGQNLSLFYSTLTLIILSCTLCFVLASVAGVCDFAKDK